MKAGELRDLLAVLTEMAPGLRAAGIGTIEHGTLKVTLAPPPPVVVQAVAADRRDSALEALHALATRRGAVSQ